MQLDLMLACQRHRKGRLSFVPPADCADTSRLHVERIATEATARRFVATHHYLGATFPAAIASFGLFEAQPRRPAELVGVAVFSVPMNTSEALLRLLRPGEAIAELGRFILTDRVGHGGETFFLAKARAGLAACKTTRCARTGATRPRHPIVVSFSDPVPRSDATGRIVHVGHVGRIYQGEVNGGAGTGMGLYVGRGATKTMWITADGSALVDRTLNKLRNGECGDRHVYAMLGRHGAPAIKPGETGREYVARALREGPFRACRHKGNHKYLFLGGSHARRRELAAALGNGLPYPRWTDPA